MKKMWQLVLGLALIFAGRGLFAVESGAVTGSYELQGVREMAGGLMLKEAGKYLAGFSYGAADWVEEGSWKLEGDEVVLSGGRFKQKNYDKLPLFLPAGTRLKYHDGKLSGSDPERKLVFIDPNKTPPGKGEGAGEGRMRVKGKVIKLDAESLVVQVDECLTFDAARLSRSLLRSIQGKVGKSIDVEIPYSAMLSASTCD